MNTRKKNTARLSISPDALDTPEAKRAIAQAANVLRAGGTVAFPTETVYGLGANALDANAVAGIFVAKQRPSWDPLIVHISDDTMLSHVAANVPARARKLIEAFWPGPLTLLLPKSATIPAEVTAGRPLGGVRMPAHPVARALIAATNLPIAAPSANRFGHTSPTTAQHVLDDLDGRIDLVIDAGPTQHGLESTVIEVGDNSITLYRLGAISMEEIEAIAGPVVQYRPPENRSRLAPESLPSPGVGMRHYAPKAIVVPLEIADKPLTDQRQEWLLAVKKYAADSRAIGLMLPTDWPAPEDFSGSIYEWGDWRDDRKLGQRLFAGLRDLDDRQVERILCPLPSDTGMGAAIRDRILKAARKS